MLICELLPLKTTKKLSSLTYFTSLKVSVGDLVEINMNGQILQALIVTAADIRSSKNEIKTQDFKIKKINKIINKSYVSENFLYELYNLATLLGTTLNNIFNTLAPISILPQIDFNKRELENENTHHIFATNLELREHVRVKKNIISGKKEVVEIKKSKNLVENTSIVNIKDKKTSASMPNFEFLLKDKNITKIIIHNESSKYYYSVFKNIDTKKALIYICKVLNVKVEYDFSDSLPSLEVYKDNFLNKNIKLNENKINANTEKNINIIKMSKNIYLDQNLEDNLLKIFKIKISESEVEIKNSKNEVWGIIDKNSVVENYNKNIQNTTAKKILLYTMRKGMYTQSICSDCSSVVKCKKCDKNYTLIAQKENHTNYNNNFSVEPDKGKEIMYHVCNTCNEKVRLDGLLRCETCNSWNIKTLGIGTQGVERYLEELFEKNEVMVNYAQKNLDTLIKEKKVGKKEVDNQKDNYEKEKNTKIKYNIFRIDSDNTSTNSKVEKEYSKFLNQSKENSILIVTEMALPILQTQSFDVIIIVSMDSAFYITDYNTDERVFFTVNKLRVSLKNEGKFFLQTRMSEKFIESNLKNICGSDLDNFYIQELKSRERNLLPPYSRILTYESQTDMSIPDFLKKYRNIKIKISFETSRFVFFVPDEVWEDDKNLRSLCLENLYNFNLKINSKEIL